MPALATDGQPLDGWGAQEIAAVLYPSPSFALFSSSGKGSRTMLISSLAW